MEYGKLFLLNVIVAATLDSQVSVLMSRYDAATTAYARDIPASPEKRDKSAIPGKNALERCPVLMTGEAGAAYIGRCNSKRRKWPRIAREQVWSGWRWVRAS